MKKILIVLLGIITIISCNKEPDTIGQMPLNSIPPGKVTNVQVENGPGKAKLTYKLPDDEDLLYVKAIYSVNESVTRESVASYYNHELIIEGFGEAKPYTVTLIAVDHSKNESAPVQVEVNPEIPPFQTAFKSLAVVPTFGGINLKWKNEFETDLNIEVYVNDTTNEGSFIEETTFYSSEDDVDVNVRGYDPEPRTFRIIVSDRWGNKTESLDLVDLVPIEELFIDPKDWIITANIGVHGAGPVARLTDGIKTGNNRALWSNGSAIDKPAFTIDLGRTVKLSRMVQWQWGLASLFYDHVNVKYFKIWGSNNPPEDLDDYTNWFLLEENGEIVKPSGLPKGEVTNEDRQQAYAGHTTDFEIEADAYRYFRFQLVEDFSGAKSFIQIMELEIYGAYED